MVYFQGDFNSEVSELILDQLDEDTVCVCEGIPSQVSFALLGDRCIINRVP